MTSTARVSMLIRRPVSDVFEAFVDPAVTTKFWFTKSTGRLDPAAHVTWTWEIYGVSSEVDVEAIVPNERIAVTWSGYDTPNQIEWRFTDRGDGTTYVEITNGPFSDPADAVSSSEGFAYTLAGAKAWLEHRLQLNLVPDKFPDRAAAKR